MPGTASRAESLLGQVVAMLRNVRSPKMRKAGMFLRFASVKRQARNACSRRACFSGGGASTEAGLVSLPCCGVATVLPFLPRLGEDTAATASLIIKAVVWLSLKFSPAGRILTVRQG